MRTLSLGNIELIPIDSKKSYFHCYSELKDYLIKLGPEYKFTTEPMNSYIVKEFKKIKIYRNFSRLYGVMVVSQIDVITDDNKFLIIDSEEDIDNFYNGEDALGFDEDGGEFDVHIDSCLSIEETKTDSVYIYRKI